MDGEPVWEETSGALYDRSEMVVVYRDSDLEKKRNRLEIMSLDTNFCVTFSVNKMIAEILKTYSRGNCLDNIAGQLALDFPRMDVYFNRSKCNDVGQFANAIKKFRAYRHKTMGNLYNLMLMVVTQPSFYYPFELINKIYSTPEYGAYIFADADAPYVSILEGEDSVDIVFKKSFKHLDIDTRTVYNRFHTRTIFTIDLYRRKFWKWMGDYCRMDFGMIYWMRDRK